MGQPRGTTGTQTHVVGPPRRKRKAPAAVPSPNNPNYPMVMAKRARARRAAARANDWTPKVSDLPLREQRRLRAGQPESKQQ